MKHHRSEVRLDGGALWAFLFLQGWPIRRASRVPAPRVPPGANHIRAASVPEVGSEGLRKRCNAGVAVAGEATQGFQACG
jgi:hypothetical protein